jgi:hypothetical protein
MVYHSSDIFTTFGNQMTKLLLAAFLLFTTTGVFAQTNNDLSDEDLKGKVRTVTEILYSDDSLQHPCMKTVDRYNRKGYLTEEIHNDYVLKIYTRKSIKYDTGSTGNITRLREFDDSGKLVRTVVYKYEAGRLVEELEHADYSGNSTTGRTEYSYDSLGHRIAEHSYFTGKPDSRTEYIYDAKGRVLTTRTYDKDDKVTMQLDYNYLGYAQGTHWVHCEKKCDNTRTHIFRTIDTRGQLVEKTTYVNDFSKETKESFSDFDRHGNWLKQSVRGKATENYFTTRSIEYYR